MKLTVVKFHRVAKEAASKEEATYSARGDIYQATDGSTKRFGNIVNADFNGNNGDAYANSNSFEISLNAALIDKHKSDGQDVDGKNVVLDYNKLITGTFSHEFNNVSSYPQSGATPVLTAGANGGLLNNPPQQIISSEVDKILDEAYDKK